MTAVIRTTLLLGVAACGPGSGDPTSDAGPVCEAPIEAVVCDVSTDTGQALMLWFDDESDDAVEALEALAGCTHIQGSLSLIGVSDLEPLRELVQIDGGLVIDPGEDSDLDLEPLRALQQAASLTLAGVSGVDRLACLQRVDTLSLVDADDPDLSALVSLTAADSLVVRGGEVDLSGLRQVTDVHTLVLDGAVSGLDGPGYAETLQALTIGEQAELDSLRGLEGVTRIEQLDLGGGGLLGLVGLDGLQSIGSDLDVDDLALETLDALGALEGDLRISPQHELQDLELGALHTVGGGVFLGGRLPPDLGGLDALRSVGGDFTMDSGTVESWAGLPSLEQVDDLIIASGSLTELGPIPISTVVRLELRDLPMVALDAFHELRTARLVAVRNTGLQHLAGFDALEAGSVRLWHNHDLVSVDAFGALRDEGTAGNPDTDTSTTGTTTTTNFAGAIMGPSVDIQFCYALQTLGFDALESASEIKLVGDLALTLEGLETLQEVGDLSLSGTRELSDLAPLEGVQRVDVLEIESNGELCQSTVDEWVAGRMVGTVTTWNNDEC